AVALSACIHAGAAVQSARLRFDSTRTSPATSQTGRGQRVGRRLGGHSNVRLREPLASIRDVLNHRFDCCGNRAVRAIGFGPVPRLDRSHHPPEYGGRAGHAMAYDSRRGVAVIYGGSVPNIEPLNDTWEWNGITWIPRQTPAQPGPS